jgi:hypothetical protein
LRSSSSADQGGGKQNHQIEILVVRIEEEAQSDWFFDWFFLRKLLLNAEERKKRIKTD